MKYSCEVIIDRPLEEVITKLDNPENMKHWQKGLIGYEFVNGEPGKSGSQMRLDYKMGKRSISMTETIVKNNFPNEFHANYDAKGVHNVQENYFEALSDSRTKWKSDSEFQFQSFGMKLMGWLMPKAFKKQSMNYLNDFKAFVEEGTSVSEQS